MTGICIYVTTLTSYNIVAVTSFDEETITAEKFAREEFEEMAKTEVK